jgi:hypothetical protein
MKAWRNLLGLGVCTLLATACTVSTGTGDDDDPIIDENSEVPDPTGESSETPDETTAEPTTPDETTEPTDTATEEPTSDVTTDDSSSSATTEEPATDTSTDTSTDEPPVGAFMCMPDTAEGECEQCVQRADRCCDERAACADDPEGACEDEWATVKSCMAERMLGENPDADPAAVVQECLAEAAGEGNDVLSVSDELIALLGCVGTSYMEPEAMPVAGDAGAAEGDAGVPESDLIEGDGLCTLACYGVDTLEPVDVNEGTFDQE